jgi:hypothetical protein
VNYIQAAAKLDGVETMTKVAACACGQVSLTCMGDPLKVSRCHCLQCQKRTGSTYGLAAFFARDNVEARGTTRAFTRVSDSGSPVTFYFCPACGSSVFWQRQGKPESIAVAVGSFADSSFPAPTQEVYIEHRHPWVACIG